MKEETLKRKQEFVSQLAERMKKFKVIAIADLRNYPDRYLQAARKKLRGDAEIIVAKNTLIKRALEQAERGKELGEMMVGPTALVMTNMNPFQLYRIVKGSKGKAAAKPGQIAPYDIMVPAGETNLPPGPVLSELKQGGVNAQIKGGKVVVATDSIVAKAGERISEATAKALQKLGVEPFEVMFNILAAWEEGVVYRKEVLDVDERKLMEDIRRAASDAFKLSFNVLYPTKQNIELLLRKAHMESMNLALNAEVYEKEAVGLMLAKAGAQASALKSKVGV